MRVTLTGASGLIGTKLVQALQGARRRRHGPVARARRARRAPSASRPTRGSRRAARRRPARSPAATRSSTSPASASTSAGPTRRSARSRESRETGTRNLVEGLRAADPRPAALISSSAVGYYGARGDEIVDEAARPGTGFLAEVCVAWEHQAPRGRGARACASCACAPASSSTARRRRARADADAVQARRRRADRRRRPVHAVDPRATTSSASTSPRSTTRTGRGPVNGSAPEPVTNAVFSRALGRALHRPARPADPRLRAAAALRRHGRRRDGGPARRCPRRPLDLGYTFRHPDLDEALRDALAELTPPGRGRPATRPWRPALALLALTPGRVGLRRHEQPR